MLAGQGANGVDTVDEYCYCQSENAAKVSWPDMSLKAKLSQHTVQHIKY